MQTIQYRKSRIWEMKEDKYAKSLSKNHFCAIFHLRNIRKNLFTQSYKALYGDDMFSLCPFQGHKYIYGRQKPTETSDFEFCYLCVNSSLEVVFILRQGMFRWQNLPKSVTFLTYIRPFLAFS